MLAKAMLLLSVIFKALTLSSLSVSTGSLEGESVRGGVAKRYRCRRQKGRLPPWRMAPVFRFIGSAPFAVGGTGDNIQALSKYNLRSAGA